MISEVCRASLLYRRISDPVRRHFSAVFPLAILYEDRPDHIRIAVVMPLHRDPDYWSRRTA
ncbi:hypothetical protein OH491_24540 [Termitidicoccus mucosus]|uniref:Plasmid stabilization protein n=1 Tax=Termitidicoccus mucosus TaxID=1184151 RepID=A0A178IPP1_9BACT|nr:hypothetical protein AW736_01960 [Opitutaceae bacterium TSB47]